MSYAADQAREHWNKTPLYYQSEERYRIYPWLPAAAEFDRHKGERVLEIGCGTGCDLLQFARNGAHAVGVDITDEHIRLARDRVGGLAEVVKADARSLPFPDASFDYVYSHGVIHHSDRPAEAVSEILRVLKRGGRFNVHLYAKWSYFPLALMWHYGGDWRLHIENSRAPVHIDLYTARSVRKLFGVPVTVEKREFAAMPFLERLFGWYLIVRGQKPQ